MNGAPAGRKKLPVNIYWLEQSASDVPAENHWLSPNETLRLAAMRIPKRRADWRLGRWTAKHAVAACLDLPTHFPDLADIEIRAASSGAPEIFLHDQPADVTISLSHSSGTALCTVAQLEASFGCDLETIEPRSDAFVADYFTVGEQALVARTPADARPLLLALLWSAKESALKALRVGLRLDTKCMFVCHLDGWPQSSGEREQDPPLPVDANPEAWRRLRVRYSGGQVFAGWWRWQNGLVRTVVSRPPLPTPLRARSADFSKIETTLSTD
ncbi:MAG: 4'-phosphopantetheinyl transferase superfamily protein [Candidatus Sulfotelmatobacter sp.]